MNTLYLGNVIPAKAGISFNLNWPQLQPVSGIALSFGRSPLSRGWHCV